MTLSVLLALPAAAQTNVFPASGNVGIGTTSPGTPLQVGGTTNGTVRSVGAGAGVDYGYELGATAANAIYANTSEDRLVFKAGGAERMRITPGGTVGIGTTSPQGPLHVMGGYGAIRIDSNTGGNIYADVSFWNGATRTAGIRSHNAASSYPNLLEIWSESGNVVFGSNVGIGTANPTHKLSVNGTIRAKEVVVDTGWADYVFADDYRLAPLSEVEAHIREKKHLPGIPSAAEVTEHGVNMGEMQAKFLAKLEEVTLHLIRMEKENAAQSLRLAALEQENGALRQQLSALNSHP